MRRVQYLRKTKEMDIKGFAEYLFEKEFLAEHPAHAGSATEAALQDDMLKSKGS